MSFTRAVFKSESVEWGTPIALYDRLNAEFRFDLDPCPMGGCSDGLSTLFVSWMGRRVFCNPPYGSSEIPKWLKRAEEAILAVYLLPARTDTRWFHDICLPKATEIRFVRGRLKFRESDPSWKPGGHTAPFPSMVVVFGSNFRQDIQNQEASSGVDESAGDVSV